MNIIKKECEPEKITKWSNSSEFQPPSKKTVVISKDGDMWCALLGSNLQDGIAGFGKTISQSLINLAYSICRRDSDYL